MRFEGALEKKNGIPRKPAGGPPIGDGLKAAARQFGRGGRPPKGIDNVASGLDRLHDDDAYIQFSCRAQAYRIALWPRWEEKCSFPAMVYGDQEPTGLADVQARLKVTREALKLSQAELCRRTGISTQSWNNAETGDERISVDNAIKLCRHSGVTLDWVYRGIPALLPADIAKKIQALGPRPARRRESSARQHVPD